MTDKEKLDAIRAEVEEYISAARKAHTNITEGNFAHLLSFIDSLQEEPVSEEWIEELRTKLDSMSKEDFKKVFDKYAVDFNEEPVSEELEEAAIEYCGGNKGSDARVRGGFLAGAKWQKEQFEKDYTNLCKGIATAKGLAVAMAYDKGVADTKEQMVKNIWKPADGDDLPEIDREVVAFQEIFPTDVDVPSLFKIVIAHRPNPEGYNGKSITTGEIEHYTPKTYDKGGWNIPDVKYWLDIELPKEIEL